MHYILLCLQPGLGKDLLLCCWRHRHYFLWSGFYSGHHGIGICGIRTTLQSNLDNPLLEQLSSSSNWLCHHRPWQSLPQLCPLLSQLCRSSRTAVYVYSSFSDCFYWKSNLYRHDLLVSDTPNHKSASTSDSSDSTILLLRRRLWLAESSRAFKLESLTYCHFGIYLCT